MSAIAGLLSLRVGPGTEEWVSEYQESILVRNSKGLNVGTTLFGLMSKLKNEPAETTEFKWFERDPVTRTVYSSAANANTSITGGDDLAEHLSFDDGSAGSVDGVIQPGVILVNNRTQEQVRVTVRESASTFTVERAFAGSVTAVLDNDTWTVITLGKDEGALPATAVFEGSDVLENYVQTFNSTVELTNAFKGSKLRTDMEGPLKERRIQALERISRDIEFAYLLGTKARKTGTNGYAYYTGGLKAAVDQIGGANVLNGGDTSGVAIDSVRDWLQSFMTVGSDAKLALCGPVSYATFSTYANSAANGFRITGQETVYGMNITTIQTPFGELDLTLHPLFKEIPAYEDWIFVSDMGHIVQKVMEPLFLESNIQALGQDAFKEQFRAKYGLKLRFAEAFGYATDFRKIN
jgi:hypothetical protein